MTRRAARSIVSNLSENLTLSPGRTIIYPSLFLPLSRLYTARYRSHRAERDIPSYSRALVASVERERDGTSERASERGEGFNACFVLQSIVRYKQLLLYYYFFFFFVVTRLFIKFDHTSTAAAGGLPGKK